MNPTNLGRKIIEIASPDGSSDWADDSISQRVGKRVLELVIGELMEPTEAVLDAGTQELWPPLRGVDWLPGSKSVAVWQAMLNAAKG